jgi:hypothetical protein
LIGKLGLEFILTRNLLLQMNNEIPEFLNQVIIKIKTTMKQKAL